MGSNENHVESNLYPTENEFCETIIGMNQDDLLNEFDNIDDLDELDHIYNKVVEDLRIKAEMLKNIQEQNEEMRSDLNSKKSFVSELDQQLDKEKQRCNSLQEMVEAAQVELEQVNAQKIENLEKFENDVAKITEKFTSAPDYYEQTYLTEEVEKLQKKLEDHKAELSQYKEELQIAEDKLKQTPDTSYCETSLKIFEESINDVKTLNEKLTFEVNELKSEVKTLGFEMSLLNISKQS